MNNDIEILYKKGTNESPPPALDSLILNAAKQSCKEKSLPRNKTNRLLFALPVAAVVVMSFSMMLNLQNKQTEMMVKPTIIIENQPNIKNHLKKKAPKLNVHQLEKDTLPLEPHTQITKSQKLINEIFLDEVIHSKLQLEQKKTNTSKFDAISASKITPLKPTKKILSKQEINSRQASGLAKSKSSEQIQDFEVINETILGNAVQVNKDFDEYDDDKVELEMVIVTGSHIRADDLIDIFESEKFNQQLEKLSSLIRKNKIAKAKRLLKNLQEIYPNYDFSDYLSELKNN